MFLVFLLLLIGLLALVVFIVLRIGGKPPRVSGARRVQYLLLALMVGGMLGYLIGAFALWSVVRLDPRVVMVDGAERHVMPTGQILFSLFAGILAGTASATIAYKLMARRHVRAAR